METFRVGEGVQSNPEFNTSGLNLEKERTSGDAFGEIVRAIIDQTNEAQLDADRKAEMFAKKKIGLVDTVLAINKADLSLRLLLEVRNKALEAYRELTRAV